jgi:predicted Holliday junction resolvase-like endonuclease
MLGFGPSAKELDLSNEIEQLRQQLEAAKAEITRAWGAREAEAALRIKQVVALQNDLEAAKKAHEGTKERLRHVSKRAARKEEQCRKKLAQ